MAELSVEDRERLRGAIKERSEVRAHLALQWVKALDRTATDIAQRGTDASNDTIAVFWIRLHGVLVEVGENYEYSRNLMKQLGAESTFIGRHTIGVHDAIVAARDAFDEDERL